MIIYHHTDTNHESLPEPHRNIMMKLRRETWFVCLHVRLLECVRSARALNVGSGCVCAQAKDRRAELHRAAGTSRQARRRSRKKKKKEITAVAT